MEFMVQERQGHDTNRRTFLTTLAGLGLTGTVTARSAEGLSGYNYSTVAQPGKSQDSKRIIWVEVKNVETGERMLFDNPSEVTRRKLNPGVYEMVILGETDTGIIERRTSFQIDDQISTSQNNGIELNVIIPAGPYLTFGSQDIVPIWVGAVETPTSGGYTPVGDVDIELTVKDKNNQTIRTFSESTNEKGNLRVTVDLDDAAHGTYSVEVTSNETESTTDAEFIVGTRTNPHWTFSDSSLSGETSLGIYSNTGSEYDDGVSRTVTITDPDGNEEDFTVNVEDGTGLYNAPLSEAGSHTVEAEADLTSSQTIQVGEYYAFCWIEITRQYIGEQGSFAGILVDSDGTVSGEDMITRIRDSRSGSVVVEKSTTTDDLGGFSIDYDVPYEDGFYEVELLVGEDNVSAAVDSRGGSPILFEESPYSPPVDPTPTTEPSINVSADVFSTGVDTDFEITVSLTDEENDPIENKLIKLKYSFTDYNSIIPAGQEEITTGSDGTATTSVTVPENAPDGDEIEILAKSTVNDNVITDSSSVRILQIDFTFESGTFSLEPGKTTTVKATASDRTTGEPIEGVETVLFAEESHLTNVFDSGFFRTDENGEATAQITTPENAIESATNAILEPYWNNTLGHSNYFSPFTVDLTYSPDPAMPGDSITVSYETQEDVNTAGIIMFPARDGAQAVSITEGEEVELEVPKWQSPGGSGRANLRIISEDGQMGSSTEWIQFADVINAKFAYEPTVPTAGEEVTLYDISESPAEIVERNWEADGATIDQSSEEVTITFDGSGEYEVTLTVTDANDNTNDITRVIPVENDIPPVTGENPPQDLNGDGFYRDVNGDDQFTIADVQVLFQNRNTEAVQNNPEAFDFNGDGEVTIADIQILFNDLFEQDDTLAEQYDIDDPKSLDQDEFVSLLSG